MSRWCLPLPLHLSLTSRYSSPLIFFLSLVVTIFCSCCSAPPSYFARFSPGPLFASSFLWRSCLAHAFHCLLNTAQGHSKAWCYADKQFCLADKCGLPSAQCASDLFEHGWFCICMGMPACSCPFYSALEVQGFCSCPFLSAFEVQGF